MSVKKSTHRVIGLVLFLFFSLPTHATFYTDRNLYESAINEIYREDFNAIDASGNSIGASVSFTSGLTATDLSGGLGFSGVPGGAMGMISGKPIGNSTTALKSSNVLLLELGGAYEAIGFDLFADVSRIYEADFGFSRAGSSSPPQGGGSASIALVNSDQLPALSGLYPEVGTSAFFGYVADGVVGIPDDPTFGFTFSNVFDSLPFDRIVLNPFDSGTDSVWIDNVTVGNFQTTPPVTSVPEPSTVALLGLGLLAFRTTRRKTCI